jgi:hypothetical protein
MVMMTVVMMNADPGMNGADMNADDIGLRRAGAEKGQGEDGRERAFHR